MSQADSIHFTEYILVTHYSSILHFIKAVKSENNTIFYNI